MKAALARDKRVSIGGTWLALVAAIALALPQPPNPARLVIGALLGLPIVILGFWAASRCRVLNVRTHQERITRGLYALLAGAGLGSVLLAVLVALARVQPLLRARFAGRAGEPVWRPFALAFESSIIEEIVFRLFVLSVTAWALFRVFRGRSTPFAVAWVFSTLLFGLAHLPQWLALTGPSKSLIAAVLALNGVGGLLFGWIFWRWGLPYAILCHAAGDVIIQFFAPRLL
jgi:CAAX prenyl protease-like protein